MKRVLTFVFLICLFLQKNAYAEAPSCLVAHSNPDEQIISVNQEYRELLQKSSEDKNFLIKVALLLQKVFMPMMFKLNRMVHDASSEDVEQMQRHLEEVSLMSDSKYVGRVAELSYQDKTVLEKLRPMGNSKDVFRYLQHDTTFSSMQVSSRGGFKLIESGILSQLLYVFGLRKDRQQLVLSEHIRAFENFKWVTPYDSGNEESSVRALQLTITPVGAYGPQLSAAMIRTSQILMYMVSHNLMDTSREMVKQNHQIITSRTARGEESKKVYTSGSGPVWATMEGILSLNQFFSLMLAEKIPGYENGSQALRALVFDGASAHGLTADFTSRLPMGVLGPMVLSGLYFKNPLAKSETGKLELSDELKQTLKAFMEIRERGGARPRGICPMAFLWKGKPANQNTDKADSSGSEFSAFSNEDQSGLQMLAEMYWKVFQVVYKSDLR